MFKNTNIKFYSSKIVHDQAIDNSYINAVVSKKNELQVELEEEIKKVQQPIQQDIQDRNEHIQQLNKRIRDYNSILEQLSTPKKNENEKVFFQSDKVKNRQEKSMLDKSNAINIEHNEKNEEEKFSNPTGVEVQLEQKNTDNIAALEQTQNSQDNSSITLEHTIREKKLKPLQPRNETGETNLANVGDVQKKFAVDVNILSGVKLKKTVQTRDVISSNINTINLELAAKLNKQRALLQNSNPIDIEHIEKSEEKFINPVTHEVQLEQKNVDNIAVPDQTQNADEDSFLLQQLQVGKQKLKKREATEQTNNLPTWVEIDFLLERLAYSTNEKEDEDLEFRLDEKISHQFNDQSVEECIKQVASLKNSYFYDKIVPILKTLKRYLPPEKFDLLSNDILVKNSEKQLDKKIFQELDLQANYFDRCLSIICEKNPSMEGFDEIEIQLQETMRQLEAIGGKRHENQASKVLNNKNVKSFENKIPTTVYFKTLSPIDNKDPVVFSATLKS